MTMKYRVGDRIRVANLSLYSGGELGAITEVVPEADRWPYTVRLDGAGGARNLYSESELELVDSTDPTVRQLAEVIAGAAPSHVTEADRTAIASAVLAAGWVHP